MILSSQYTRVCVASEAEIPGGGNTQMSDGRPADEHLSGREYLDKGYDPKFPYKGRCKGCQKHKHVNFLGWCQECQEEIIENPVPLPGTGYVREHAYTQW